MRFVSIASGSSGNCIYAGTENTHILIDAGISARRMEQGLTDIGVKGSELDGIVITHEHSDHVKGLGVLARKFGIPIYSTEGTLQEIRGMKCLGEYPEELLTPVRPDVDFAIGDMVLEPFRIDHDAADPVGYRIRGGRRSVAVATDMGCYNDYIVEHLKGVNGILLEANHDVNMLQVGTYPYPLKQRILGRLGHLSNDNAGRLLCEILHDDLKSIVLGHLSRENNYEALAYATVCAEITMGDNPYKADDFPIQVAKRDQALPVIAL